MDDLIELATYNDDDYGLVIQFLDGDDNYYFYTVEINEDGEKVYTKLDENISHILEDRYVKEIDE